VHQAGSPATSFYRDILELPFLGEFDPPGLAFFDLGGTRLLLDRGAPPALLYLGVDDIAAERARLAALGVEFEDEIHLIHSHGGSLGQRQGTEEQMLFFRDSEGSLLGLSERAATVVDRRCGTFTTCGAPGRDRTCDLRFRKPLLSPLSYRS
jgi:methylmalonyl-CoA/ethylmalonyl-CoA epimerase